MSATVHPFVRAGCAGMDIMRSLCLSIIQKRHHDATILLQRQQLAYVASKVGRETQSVEFHLLALVGKTTFVWLQYVGSKVGHGTQSVELPFLALVGRAPWTPW